MCAVTHKAKPYQLALLMSLVDVIAIGTQQSACEATLQHQYKDIHFSLIYYSYALFGESLIDTFKEKCSLHKSFYVYLSKLPFRVFFI